MIGASVLQTAIYAALTTPTMSAQVFDELPQGTSLTKYVLIGEISLERPWDTHDGEGSEQFQTIHVWHNPTVAGSAKGAREVQLIMEEIDARLHNQNLALSSGDLVLLQRDFTTVLRENVDGATWRHGVLRYRALLTE